MINSEIFETILHLVGYIFYSVHLIKKRKRD
jgi:hypothetical protein